LAFFPKKKVMRRSSNLKKLCTEKFQLVRMTLRFQADLFALMAGFRRTLALMLAGGLLLALAGCASGPESEYDLNLMYIGQQPSSYVYKANPEDKFFMRECHGTHDPYPDGSHYECD